MSCLFSVGTCWDIRSMGVFLLAGIWIFDPCEYKWFPVFQLCPTSFSVYYIQFVQCGFWTWRTHVVSNSPFQRRFYINRIPLCDIINPLISILHEWQDVQLDPLVFPPYKHVECNIQCFSGCWTQRDTHVFILEVCVEDISFSRFINTMNIEPSRKILVDSEFPEIDT